MTVGLLLVVLVLLLHSAGCIILPLASDRALYQHRWQQADDASTRALAESFQANQRAIYFRDRWNAALESDATRWAKRLPPVRASVKLFDAELPERAGETVVVFDRYRYALSIGKRPSDPHRLAPTAELVANKLAYGLERRLAAELTTALLPGFRPTPRPTRPTRRRWRA